MGIDKKTVEDVAYLARIELTPKELERLSQQLEHIIGFIDKLSSLNTEKTIPMSHLLPINNVLREDLPKPSLTIKKTLMNSPQSQDNFFVVPKVIE